MECSEVLNLLSGHIDQINTEQEEAALQAHLAECAHCRELLKAYEKIDSNVAELNVPAPDNLVSSVMKQITIPAKTKHRSPWRNIGMSAGLVAAVLVLLIGTKTIKLPDVSDNRAEMKSQSVTEANVPQEIETQLFAYAPQATEPQEVKTEAQQDGYSVGDYEGINGTDVPAYEGNDLTLNGQGNRFKRHFELSFAPELFQKCMTMSEDNYAAVLLYDGIDKSFFLWLKEQAPELAERFETNSEMAVDEENGTITVMSDYSTVMALHEWLLSQMCATQTAEQAEQIGTEDLESLGLPAAFAERVFTFHAPEQTVVWPEHWAEDFSIRWLTGENWRLFYPEEDYLPEEEDIAFLVLVPPTDTNEAIR